VIHTANGSKSEAVLLTSLPACAVRPVPEGCGLRHHCGGYRGPGWQRTVPGPSLPAQRWPAHHLDQPGGI